MNVSFGHYQILMRYLLSKIKMQPDLVKCSQFSILTIILEDFLSAPNTLHCVPDITYQDSVSYYQHTSARTIEFHIFKKDM